MKRSEIMMDGKRIKCHLKKAYKVSFKIDLLFQLGKLIEPLEVKIVVMNHKVEAQ